MYQSSVSYVFHYSSLPGVNIAVVLPCCCHRVAGANLLVAGIDVVVLALHFGQCEKNNNTLDYYCRKPSPFLLWLLPSANDDRDKLDLMRLD